MSGGERNGHSHDEEERRKDEVSRSETVPCSVVQEPWRFRTGVVDKNHSDHRETSVDIQRVKSDSWLWTLSDLFLVGVCFLYWRLKILLLSHFDLVIKSWIGFAWWLRTMRKRLLTREWRRVLQKRVGEILVKLECSLTVTIYFHAFTFRISFYQMYDLIYMPGFNINSSLMHSFIYSLWTFLFCFF